MSGPRQRPGRPASIDPGDDAIAMQATAGAPSPAAEPRSDTRRAVWIDFARGIGVILVVYGHVLGGLVRPGLFPDGAPARWMDYTLYTFHMPLFFFLSGLFAAAVAAGGALSSLDANGLASLPACVLGIVVLCKLLDGARHRWLAVVGMMSMTIYVLHILAGSGTRIIMMKLHVPAWPWVYLLAGTAAGVILPMLAHVVLQRLHLLAALGLAPLRTRRPPTAG